jgi:glucose-6-phosphate-specific signal transduction histidine kinase
LKLAMTTLVGSLALAILAMLLHQHQGVSPAVLISKGVAIVFYPVLLAYAFWQRRGGQKLWMTFAAIAALTAGILLAQALFP